jgi:hypothetical protein
VHVAGDPVMDWLMRPWLAGHCGFTDLKNGDLDIVDIAWMNHVMDVEAENNWRAHKAQSKD